MSVSSLGLTCPDGGHFYVCQGNTTQFLGCCAVDPCAAGTGSCPQASLRNTSYTSDDYESIPAQACVASSSSSSSSSSLPLWYTCADTTPPFLGCCEGENPCVTGGCGGRNGTLTAARLSDNVTDALPFMTVTSSSGQGDKMVMLSTRATVGIAVGSALGALALGVILFLVYRRRERKKQAEEQQKATAGPNRMPTVYDMGTPYQDSTGFPSPPFPYTGGYTYGEDKIASLPSTPGRGPVSSPPLHQRATSLAPSYLSAASTSVTDRPLHNYSPSLPSTESLGGLYVMQAQQRDTRRTQQFLNPVSEMDSAEIARPVSELPGSISHVGAEEEHTYGRGYKAVRERGDL
ncbi:hypothetical protein BD289DRAFT_32640 [Coniella lustricola]|uniref:Uncharacterized protein n=1 Tax=Coniella lustricola TaxID=2025994 RepID=A0A2T3A2P9_9PEZI|nr:hypothetical protein BD289DRAFT_32640 [Coniella lustricola]